MPLYGVRVTMTPAQAVWAEAILQRHASQYPRSRLAYGASERLAAALVDAGYRWNHLQNGWDRPEAKP